MTLMLVLLLLNLFISEKPQGHFPFSILDKYCGNSYYEESEMAQRLCDGSLSDMVYKSLVTSLPCSVFKEYYTSTAKSRRLTWFTRRDGVLRIFKPGLFSECDLMSAKIGD